MIRHQRKCVNLYLEIVNNLLNNIEEKSAVFIMSEDWCPPCPTVHYVMPGARKIDSVFSCHGLRANNKRPVVRLPIRMLFPLDYGSMTESSSTRETNSTRKYDRNQQYERNQEYEKNPRHTCLFNCLDQRVPLAPRCSSVRRIPLAPLMDRINPVQQSPFQIKQRGSCFSH